jgi:SAM-dependent methyltransferase
MIITGELVTPGGTRYPIVRGIPRFVSGESYTSSFGYEWNRWPRVQFDAENIGRPMSGHTTRMWEIITGVGDDKIKGKTIVEFGCGPGRFLDVVRRKGGRGVGIDLSQAVEVARRNFADDPDVLVVQGDIFSPPFREGVFDGGFTIGVLHHTPDPLGALKALALTVKPGGRVACCVYPKGGFYDYPSVARFRRVHNRLNPVLSYRAALAYAYFAAILLAPTVAKGKRLPLLRRLLEYVEQNWLVSLYLPDVHWRLLDTFDAITPSIATTHTGKEVREWMEESGCVHVRSTDWCETAVVGIRSDKCEEAYATQRN